MNKQDVLIQKEKTMKKMTLNEFQAALKGQGVPLEDAAVRCPMCDTVQSAKDFIIAGVGDTFEDVEKYLGFSCFGRFMDAGTPRRKPDGNPCNWTLGGLFSMHKLVVVTPDGREHPCFEVATAEEAQKLKASRKEISSDIRNPLITATDNKSDRQNAN